MVHVRVSDDCRVDGCRRTGLPAGRRDKSGRTSLVPFGVLEGASLGIDHAQSPPMKPTRVVEASRTCPSSMLRVKKITEPHPRWGEVNRIDPLKAP